MQEEAKANTSNPLTTQESEISKLAQTLPPKTNTIIPHSHNDPQQQSSGYTMSHSFMVGSAQNYLVTPHAEAQFLRYFHSVVTHAPLLHHIIPLRSVNTEMQERVFGQAKQITKATSNQKPDHTITNILIRMQEEAKANTSNPLTTHQ